jgi:hypothetical protein
LAGWRLSHEVAILAHPRAAYETARAAGGRGGGWIGLRRPLFAALLLGATVSFLATATLTLRLVLGGALTWSFVPLCETLSLAVTCRTRPAALSRARALDLFFAGQGAWSLVLIIVSAAAAFSDPLRVYAWTAWPQEALIGIGLLGAALWSGYVDLCFFRVVLEYPPAKARRALVLQRALCWSASLAWFVGMAGSPYVFALLRR